MILYPRGMGGSWLSNLIWHLEHNNTQLPRVTAVFDSEPGCSIPFGHGHKTANGQELTAFDPRLPDSYLFSCCELFNHYLNNAVKVKYHIHKLHNKPWLEQLFELSNGAVYYFSNTEYQDYYCKDINLDYRLVFADPKQFTSDLFVLLNKLDIRYTAAPDYVLSSIEYYQSTCPNPADHYDNFDSILWLACCHAITLVDDLYIAEPIKDLESAQQLLAPYAEHCKDRIKPRMFEWKK